MSMLSTIRGVPINHRFFPVYNLSRPSLHPTLNGCLLDNVKTNLKSKRTYVVETFCPSCNRCVEEREIILLQDDLEGCMICHPNYNSCDQCGYWVAEDLQISNEGEVCNRCFETDPLSQSDAPMAIPDMEEIKCFGVVEPSISRISRGVSPKSLAGG